MILYQNKRFGFSLNLPEGWRPPRASLWKRLLFLDKSLHFIGPQREHFMVNAGPLIEKLDFLTFRRSFMGYLSTIGYENVRFGSFWLGGQEHHWACYSLTSGRVHKKYSLVFGNTEFAVYADLGYGDIDDDAVLERENIYDGILGSFKVL